MAGPVFGELYERVCRRRDEEERHEYNERINQETFSQEKMSVCTSDMFARVSCFFLSHTASVSRLPYGELMFAAMA